MSGARTIHSIPVLFLVGDCTLTFNSFAILFTVVNLVSVAKIIPFTILQRLRTMAEYVSAVTGVIPPRFIRQFETSGHFTSTP